MIVIEGKRTRQADPAAMTARLAAAARVVIDVGTGDGRFAYALAGDHPDWLVVGMDAISERLAEFSAKAARKPAKGGRPNLVYVRASAEDPPVELHGTAHEVDVLLPWGALLAGCVDPAARPAVLAGLVRLAQPTGADIRIVFNAEPWEESTPKDMADLPPVTVEYVEQTLAPVYRHNGIEVTAARDLDPQDVEELRTTWAKRLAASHRGRPHFVELRGRTGP